ncbi:MAG: hypothetical protein M3Q44_07735 [bacterium]|nr:hypothetical protein [bacterium]
MKSFDVLKSEILANQFIYKLRLEFKIDEIEYSQLIRSLSELSLLWKSEKLIDKQLMEVLYGLPSVIREQIREEYPKEQQNRLIEMKIKIDGLILECLDSRQSD